MNRFSFVAAILCLSIAINTGCNGGGGVQSVPVTGLVTYQGKPLADVNVLFTPRSGPPATGLTDAEGKYTLITIDQPGAVVGSHQVSLTPNQGEVDMPLPGQPPATTKSTVPAKYSRAESSGLTAEVKADGENHFVFNLTD